MEKKLGISNQDKIKLEHQNLVYGLFRDHPCYSCADVACITGLSNTAVATIVKGFLDANLIKVAEGAESTGKTDRGRPSVLYELNPDYGLVAAIDLTDQSLIICVSNMRMQLICRREIPGCVYITMDNIQKIIAILRDILKNQAKGLGGYSAVCIGTPGKIDAETGYFVYAPKFIDYKSINLRSIFSKAFDVPVIIKNDIKLALMGESYFGSAVAQKTVVYLHIDNSYGGAIKLNGKIFEGEHGFAGEFGGRRVLDKQKLFRYVSYIISLGGMVFAWENYFRENESWQSNERLLTAEHFIDRYDAGDPIVLRIADEAAEMTAIEILNTSMLLDVSTFILDGRIKLLGEEYLAKIKGYIAQYNYDNQQIGVSYSLLQGRATILGGLRCAIDTVSKALLKQI